MSDVRRGYRIGRAIAAVTIALGAVALLGGAVVMGVGGLSLVRAGNPFGALKEVVAIAAGLSVVVVGLVAMAIAHHVRASFDMADMTREMLTLARRRAGAETGATPPGPPLSARTRDGAGHALSPARAPRPVEGGAKVHPIFSARPPG